MALSEYQKSRMQNILNGRPLKSKEKKPIAKVSKKRQAKLDEAKKVYLESKKTSNVPNEIIEQLTLNQWFDYHMEHSEPVCAECGMRADWVKQPGYEKIWKACQAHILPKKKTYGFPSISNHLENHIVLFPSWGGHLCGCHGFYDSSWYNATTMKIWPHVQQKFKTLYPFIKETERKNIPEQLSQLIL